MKCLVEKTMVVALVYLLAPALPAHAAKPELDRAAWAHLIKARGVKKLKPIGTLVREPVQAMGKPAIAEELRKKLQQQNRLASPEQIEARVEQIHAAQLQQAEEQSRSIFSGWTYEDFESGKELLDEVAARADLAQQFGKAGSDILDAIQSGPMALKTVQVDGQDRKLLLIAGRELSGFAAQREAYLFLETPTGFEITHGYVDRMEFAAE